MNPATSSSDTRDLGFKARAGPNSDYTAVVQTVSITTAKTHLNELVEAASRTHEHVTITKNGEPAAVMVGADEWEALQETLFWLSQPGIREDLDRADRDVVEGNTLDEAAVRARLGVPRRG